MKRLRPIALSTLFLGILLSTSPSKADGLKECLQSHQQQPAQITTPTHAFIKRQCDAVKRGVATIPGMKELFPNSRTWGTQLKR